LTSTGEKRTQGIGGPYRVEGDQKPLIISGKSLSFQGDPSKIKAAYKGEGMRQGKEDRIESRSYSLPAGREGRGQKLQILEAKELDREGDRGGTCEKIKGGGGGQGKGRGRY